MGVAAQGFWRRWLAVALLVGFAVGACLSFLPMLSIQTYVACQEGVRIEGCVTGVSGSPRPTAVTVFGFGLLGALVAMVLAVPLRARSK